MGTRAPTRRGNGDQGTGNRLTLGSPFPVPWSLLLRVQLDDQLLLGGDRNAGPLRPLEHAPTERVAVHRDPRERRATRRLVHRRHDRRHLARLHADAHFLAGVHEVARDVNRLLVDLDVAVTNELPRRLAASGEAHAVHDVVQPALECSEQVVTRDARQRCNALERVAELTLTHAIDALDLLLLAELLRVLGRLAATRRVLAVLARRIRATLDGALFGEALRSLEKQLRALAAALTAARSSVASHRLDPPPLRGTAAVVRNRRDVLDRFHLETSGGERLNGRLAARARTLHA